MVERLVVAGGHVLTPQGWVDADVLVEDGRIDRIAPSIKPAAGAKVVPAKGARVLPGLIDLQVNGAFGKSFASANADEIADAARGLSQFGVTGFLPTIISTPIARAIDALSRMREAKERGGGARILGAHLEGPFLNPERAGAHRPEHIRKPSLREFARLATAGGAIAKMMTIAPEMKGAVSLVAAGAKRGIVMSIGHSAAGRAEVEAAVRAGARAVTHLFNAMGSFHHRGDNLIAAALLEDRLACGLIYDRHHVSRDAMRIALRCKPEVRLLLVTDAVAALGMPEGAIEIDGEKYVVKGGEVKVRGTDTRAGSAVSILDGVRAVAEDGPLPLEAAWRMASAVPARILGVEGITGEIAPGAAADLVLLEDGWKVGATFVGGRQMHGDLRQG